MADYIKLKNQPLKFVLAEFHFSPVMQIAEYMPKIQEPLRKQYQILDKRNMQTVEVQLGGIAVSAIDSWASISWNKKNAIELNQERLIYTTTEYPSVAGFSNA